MVHLKPIAVIFDLNVYLDIARLIEEPFNETKLRTMVLRYKPDISKPNRKLDAAAAVLLSSTGNLAGQQRLQVWSSTWIERGVENVAKRPKSEVGLEWNESTAKGLRNDLIMTLAVGKSNGQSLREERYVSYSPLSDDDSSVFHTARQALNFCSAAYCVTSDTDFIRDAPNMGVKMMTPGQLVELIRRARA